jgi:hypothetical protein
MYSKQKVRDFRRLEYKKAKGVLLAGKGRLARVGSHRNIYIVPSSK